MRVRSLLLLAGAATVLAGFLSTSYESYGSLYDADYVGSRACGECHPQIHGRWQGSPHHLMARPADASSVVGDFADREWRLPPGAAGEVPAGQPAARMYRKDGGYCMAIYHPPSRAYAEFTIDYVVGYQYRQTYLHREPGGVLRKLPLEWSPARGEFFDYWSYQEHQPTTLIGLWEQTQVPNSAWNLFCARCHTTHLEVLDKDAAHKRAATRWTEDGIGCEACHGPGSAHANYFRGNYVNRFVAFANSKLRGQPVAFIASARKLTKGQDLSVCGRCHGPDIQMATTEVYRTYEPGYSKAGKVNDLSPHFFEMPLEPGRKTPTTECWDDGRPKGIAMLFRSFLESKCYQQAEVRCYDCHDPHANKLPASPGMLAPSAASDAWCLRCHESLREQLAAHVRHPAGTPGSFCYDCHLPRHILNLATGVQRFTRTHTLSSIPDPVATGRFGQAGAPNACNDCHQDKTPAWAAAQLRR